MNNEKTTVETYWDTIAKATGVNCSWHQLHPMHQSQIIYAINVQLKAIEEIKTYAMFEGEQNPS